jgi:hypothetical protein
MNNQGRGRWAKLFTLDEARALLPAVRGIVEAIRARKQGLDQETARLDEAGARARGNGHGPRGALDAQARAERLAAEIRAGIERLSALGVEMKGIDEGLVDFPSERDGRIVYLCWRIGEPDIGFWHELDAGFRGRQRL